MDATNRRAASRRSSKERVANRRAETRSDEGENARVSHGIAGRTDRRTDDAIEVQRDLLLQRNEERGESSLDSTRTRTHVRRVTDGVYRAVETSIEMEEIL